MSTASCLLGRISRQRRWGHWDDEASEVADTSVIESITKHACERVGFGGESVESMEGDVSHGEDHPTATRYRSLEALQNAAGGSEQSRGARSRVAGMEGPFHNG